MGNFVCVTYSTFTGRGSHQKQHFWRLAGEQDRKYICYNSAGQMLWMTDVVNGGALCCRRGQELSCGFWLRAHSATRRSLTSLRWGTEYVSFPNLFKLLLLQAMTYFPKDSWQYSICILTGILWNMALIPFNSWYSIQFNSFKYKNWVLRGWIARIALWRQTWHMFSEIILCYSGAFKILFLHGNYTLIIILS